MQAAAYIFLYSILRVELHSQERKRFRVGLALRLLLPLQPGSETEYSLGLCRPLNVNGRPSNYLMTSLMNKVHLTSS